MTDFWCNQINTPMLSLTAIAYPSGQTIQKETYLVDIPPFSGQSHRTLRVEVYYNTLDRSKAINIANQCVGSDAYNSAGGANCGNYIAEITGSGDGPYEFFTTKYVVGNTHPQGTVAWLKDFRVRKLFKTNKIMIKYRNDSLNFPITHTHTHILTALYNYWHSSKQR
jgi:hypothetical protein